MEAPKFQDRPLLSPPQNNKGEECTCPSPEPVLLALASVCPETLMSHLIWGVDSPVPGPRLASELAWRLGPSPGSWTSGPSSRGSLWPTRRTSVCAHGLGAGVGRAGCARALAVSDASLPASGDLGREFKAG